MAKVIYNDLIPFKGFQAITILPFIFARNSAKPLKDYVVNHETIHLRQQLEVLVASLILFLAMILMVVALRIALCVLHLVRSRMAHPLGCLPRQKPRIQEHRVRAGGISE